MLTNVFEQNGFKPGQKIKYDGFEMTVDSCWKLSEIMGGLKQRIPMLCCHWISNNGFEHVEFNQYMVDKIEKVSDE